MTTPPAATPATGAPAAAAGWAERAARVIPGGSGTGSKRPAALYGHEGTTAPTHFRSARGCRVRTADGRELLDFTMALGSVALGYADPEVTAAVQRAAGDGNVSGLAHVAEVELAERLCAVVPCAEQVRFLKSGAEGVAAAVRLARTLTARDCVLGSGYFGWLDWWSEAAGVPAGVRADYRHLPFDDVAALEEAVLAVGDRLAAIVLEPVQERAPSTEWLRAARAAAERAGAVLVFDEVKTGFRVHQGGWQAVCGVLPDVAVFGKAMANGHPLAAVLGRRSVMEAAQRTWISSTLAGESLALAAAGAVLDRHAREDVATRLGLLGDRQMTAVRAALAHADAPGVTLHGLPHMWFLRHADAAAETRFLEHAVESGALLKRGAYQFPALPHDDDSVHQRLAEVVAGSLAAAYATPHG